MPFQKGNQCSKGRNIGNQYAKGNQAGKKNRKEITWEVNENGCWICKSHAFNTKGYPRHRVNGKIKSISHTMYEKYNGEITNGMHVCHRCDNPNCINLEHLFLGTNADNMADRNGKNRQSKGEKHSIKCRGENMGTHKLTEEEVREIKYGCNGMLHQEIADKFGVARNTITYIKNNKLWKHI
jgi:hypothetical protein